MNLSVTLLSGILAAVAGNAVLVLVPSDQAQLGWLLVACVLVALVTWLFIQSERQQHLTHTTTDLADGFRVNVLAPDPWNPLMSGLLGAFVGFMLPGLVWLTLLEAFGWTWVAGLASLFATLGLAVVTPNEVQELELIGNVLRVGNRSIVVHDPSMVGPDPHGVRIAGDPAFVLQLPFAARAEVLERLKGVRPLIGAQVEVPTALGALTEHARSKEAP